MICVLRRLVARQPNRARSPGRLAKLIAAACLAAWWFAPASQGIGDDRGAQPNIVFILADDLGYGDVGCYNAKSKISTPHLDQLATAGMRFTDAHAPAAVCVPTRYALLTGRYPFRREPGTQGSEIHEARLTLGKMLQQQGYRTACVGKWHLGWEQLRNPPHDRPFAGGPLDRGFDHFFGIPASLDIPPYYYARNDRVVAPPTEQIGDRNTPGWSPIQGEFWRGGGIAPGFRHAEVLPTLTGETLAFLREHQRQAAEQPFFLYFAMTGPHTPWLPDEKFQGRSQAAMYGDFVMQIDDCVGQVVAALDELKLADNTLLIVASDNGPVWYPHDVERLGHSAAGPLRGVKADAWEGGHRVPFVARWPGHVPAGRTCDETICLTDLFATCAALTGAELPDDAAEDSHNILPLLLGQPRAEPVREATIHQSSRGVLAIRQGPWKLIPSLGSGGFISQPHTIAPEPGGPTGQLYHLERDLGETTNLFAEEPEVARRLSALLEKYRRQGYSRPRPAAATSAAATSAADDSPPPNIVLVMADDQGWGDASYNGHPTLKTPHLDAMARAGLRLDRFYAAAPVCSPTRGSCLTGRHPYRYGVRSANVGHLPAEEVTLQRLLAQRGYATGHFGKWHLGTLTTTVVDANRGGPRGKAHYAPPWERDFAVCFSTESKVPTWDPLHGPRGRANSPWWAPLDDLSQGQDYGTRYWTGPERPVADLQGCDSRLIMDRALEFIAGAAREQRPFFTVVWFHAPHLPVVAGDKYRAPYADLPPYTQHYYGAIAALDEQVGRLRERLRSLGVADNTLVFYTSDNGPEGNASAPGSSGGLRGRKRSLYEGGVRALGLAEWPARIAAGRRTSFPAVTTDYLPTIVELLDLQLPDDRPLDGVSLARLLTGDDADARPRPIGFESGPQAAWIDGRWKLYIGDLSQLSSRTSAGQRAQLLQALELYDLEADPAESRSLAGDEPERAFAMLAQLQAWRESCKASAAGADYGAAAPSP